MELWQWHKFQVPKRLSSDVRNLAKAWNLFWSFSSAGPRASFGTGKSPFWSAALIFFPFHQAFLPKNMGTTTCSRLVSKLFTQKTIRLKSSCKLLTRKSEASLEAAWLWKDVWKADPPGLRLGPCIIGVDLNFGDLTGVPFWAAKWFNAEICSQLVRDIFWNTICEETATFQKNEFRGPR